MIKKYTLYPTIEGPDNPTTQLLPIMSTKGCSGDREGKTKEVVEDPEVKQSCVWQSCMWKMVCDKERWCACVCATKLCERWCVCVKVVCERERVTKLCVNDGMWQMWCVKDGVAKDGVWQSCVWKVVWRKMVCDKVVCEIWCGERWCVTKWCVKDGVVKDGVRQSGVWKMVCDKVVCERWCVKEGVWQDGVWKMVCERGCVKHGVWKMVCQTWCVKDGESNMVCDKVGFQRWCVKVGGQRWCVKDGVWKNAKRRWMSPSATPATQSAAASPATKTGPSAPPEPVQCHKCHACHAKSRWMWPSATPATQNQSRCRQAPRPPRKVPRRHRRLIRSKRATRAGLVKRRYIVTKCHACHAKPKVDVAKCAPAMQNAAASPATNPVQARQHSQPNATSATPARQNEDRCRQVPRLPRQTKVDVAKCHACHAKWHGVTGD